MRHACMRSVDVGAVWARDGESGSAAVWLRRCSLEHTDWMEVPCAIEHVTGLCYQPLGTHGAQPARKRPHFLTPLNTWPACACVCA